MHGKYKNLWTSTNELDYLQQSSPKIQDPFILWVALQVKGSISIFSLLQQRDLKENTLQMGLEEREYPNLGYASPDT